MEFSKLHSIRLESWKSVFIIWQFVNLVFGIFRLEKEQVEIMQLSNSTEKVRGIIFEKSSPMILQSWNFMFWNLVFSSSTFDRLQF